jgi:chemotaxis methyl-accepting protein methylase
MKPIAQTDLDRFRSIVAARLGLQFDASKNDLLLNVLRQRLGSDDPASISRYLASISPGSDGREELRQLAAHLTVTETYFFRDHDQFLALHPHDRPRRLIC